MSNEKYGYIGVDVPEQSFKNNKGLLEPSEINELVADDKWTQYGQLELIETQVASGSSTSINFENIKGQTYDTHLLVASNVAYASGSANTSIRVSNDGGSSYESNNDYQLAILWASQVAGFNEYNTTAYSQIDIGLLGGSTANLCMNFYTYIHNASNPSKYTYFTTHGTAISSASHHGQGMFYGGGLYVNKEEIDAFSLFGDGGQVISTATISLYGIKSY